MRPKTRSAIAGLALALTLPVTGPLAPAGWAHAGLQGAGPGEPGGVALGPCRGALCGFDGPEDIAVLAGSRWLVVSGQGRGQGDTGLVAIDTRGGRRIAFARPTGVQAEEAGCLSGRAGGIGVRREGKGYRLLRIVHGAHDTIERWRLAVDRHGVTAQRLGCLAVPPALYLNDLAPLPEGSLVATHMFDRALDRAALEALLARGAPTGEVMRWTPTGGWAPVPGAAGSFPNGVDASADGGVLVYAETYGRRVTRLAPDGRGAVHVALAMQPDNVTLLSDHEAIVTGGTGAPMASTRNCAGLGPAGCAFPSSAVLVDFRARSWRPLVRSAGLTSPGFSVTVRAGGAWWLGTAFGDRLTRVALTPQVAELP